MLLVQSRQPHHDERQDDDPQLGQHPQKDARPPRTVSSATKTTNHSNNIKQSSSINKTQPDQPQPHSTPQNPGSDTHIRGFGTGAIFFCSFPFPPLPTTFSHPATIFFGLSILCRLFSFLFFSPIHPFLLFPAFFLPFLLFPFIFFLPTFYPISCRSQHLYSLFPLCFPSPLTPRPHSVAIRLLTSYTPISHSHAIDHQTTNVSSPFRSDRLQLQLQLVQSLSPALTLPPFEFAEMREPATLEMGDILDQQRGR